ncbi:MAG: hypothetical protein A3I66_10040 [Burkholderiales bacterium RIFCSPLOWO2_02_FULL_57_36]|nr:MAG: hypothetical protein A3I66_10040 [Burkholderiales bacterium RIFCSPLOWO2_02_FULL_57_36]
MEKKSERKKPNHWSVLARNYSGPLAHVALSAVSAWMIVTGLKGLAGFTVNSQTALADLLGIVIVIGVIRWMKARSNPK